MNKTVDKEAYGDGRPRGVAPVVEDLIIVGENPESGVRWRPGDRLHHLFEASCDLLGKRDGRNRVAVDTGDAVLSYGQLDAGANRLARYLLTLGAGAGDRIALLCDQAVDAYTAMLAILKIHAAYVPLDLGFPADRLAYIADDAGVRMVLSLSHLRERLNGIGASLVYMDEVAALVATQSDRRLDSARVTGAVDEVAYIIYTSGSTGRPKGVVIEHASICNFVRVAAESYGITATDRVYQGMTLAFDFSVEEIWVPWACGATLVPKPAGGSLVGEELADYLQTRRITAMCCVPTLLATLDGPLPELRFLLVSGEACPNDLVSRWHRPDRRFLNVYGPTEATVTATWQVLHPDKPVSLGVPLPTYSIVILDPERDRALPVGEMGEIGIAGIGLSRGYVNRQDLTERAFIPDFIGISSNPSGKIYRTGDLGRINADREIEYHGRIDTQVKVRGYRIELTEIESVLLQVPGIAQAVVATHEAELGEVDLVAYYCPRRTVPRPDHQHIYDHLRARLPGYMIPAYLEELVAIPMLPSDKADRKSLPAPKGPRNLPRPDQYTAPANDMERALADRLAEVLRVDRVSVADHFFEELGANSLLMARFCADARRQPGLGRVSIKDVYLNPTIRGLANVLGGQVAVQGASPPPPDGAGQHRASSTSYVLCGLAQLVVALGYIYASTFALVAAMRWVRAAAGSSQTLERSVVVAAAGVLALCTVPILAKWALIGRWTSGEIRIWSTRYLRFWTVKTLIRANPLVIFVGSPLYSWYLRALGAKIGPGVSIFSRHVPVATDLLTIGAGTVIRKDAFFNCYRAHHGLIQTGRVSLGSNVFVGEKTVLDIDTALGDDAQLGHSSSLLRFHVVPAGECWHGSPAQRADANYRVVPAANVGTRRRATYGLLQLLGLLLFYLPLAIGTLSAVLDNVMRWESTNPTDWQFYYRHLLISALLFYGSVLIGLAIVVTVPRLLNMALTPGRTYPLYGIHYWIHQRIVRLTNLQFFMNLFGDSSYVVHYLRVLGYDLGRVEQTGSNFGTELKHESPYLSEVGTGTMVSDALSIMNADFSSTSFRLGRVSIGAHNFLGNHIAYPTEARVGENCLLATKVMVPTDGPIRQDVGLLGSPCFEIPRSVQRDKAFDALRTGNELRDRLAAKNRYNITTMGLFLLVRWGLFYGVTLLSLIAATLYQDSNVGAVALVTALLPIFALGYAVLVERAATGFRALSPKLCSIYDRYFWRHERLWKLLAMPRLNGTPFKNVLWRLLGVRLGRRVFDDGCSIPEKTLVSIGHDCTLNQSSLIQCHSLEDGIFKSDHTIIGAGCTLGVEAFVHYGVTIGEGAVVEADSFIMKGEEIPARTRWGGNPGTSLRAAPTVSAEVVPASAAWAVGGKSRAERLLRDLRACPWPQPPQSGIAVATFSLSACRPRQDELLKLLGPDDDLSLVSLLSKARHDAYLFSRALIRLILSTELRPHIPPQDWRFRRSEHGKLVVDQPAETGIDLSISYAEEALAVAISDIYDVGVDIEVLNGRGPHAIAWGALTPAERTELAAAPADQQLARFLLTWTAKEALVKSTGLGISVDFAGVHPPPTATGIHKDQNQDYWLHQQQWSNRERAYYVSVAARNRTWPGPGVSEPV